MIYDPVPDFDFRDPPIRSSRWPLLFSRGFIALVLVCTALIAVWAR